MPTHELIETLRNSVRRKGISGRSSGRIEVATASDDDFKPQYALGDPYNSVFNLKDVGANEVQTLRIQGANGGTFTITYSGQTTAALGYDATAAEVEDALIALSNVYPGDIVVTKSGTTADHTYTFKFGGQLAKANRAEVTVANSMSSAGDVNEVQTITVDATGGTFTVTFSGQTTPAQAFNVSAADLQTALRALSSVGGANVTVSGGPGAAGGGTPYTVTFIAALGAQNVAAMTTNAASLTGGAGTAAVATTTPGVDGTTVTIATTTAGSAS